MLTVFDLNSRTMLYGPDFWELTAGYTEFHGVSFVSSFDTISQLSQRFEQVKLILGLEEATTSGLLRQIFDPTRRVRKLETASEPLLARYREHSPLNTVSKDEHTRALLVAERERAEREKAELKLELEAERVALLTRQVQDAEACSRGWGRLWRR